MRPVRGAESIVHVKITQLGKRLGEFWIVRLLARVETNIFEQRDIAVLHVLNDFLRHVTNGVVTENDGVMDRECTYSPIGRSEYFSTGLPLGRPKCDIKMVFAPCSRR